MRRNEKPKPDPIDEDAPEISRPGYTWPEEKLPPGNPGAHDRVAGCPAAPEVPVVNVSPGMPGSGGKPLSNERSPMPPGPDGKPGRSEREG